MTDNNRPARKPDGIRQEGDVSLFEEEELLEEDLFSEEETVPQPRRRPKYRRTASRDTHSRSKTHSEKRSNAGRRGHNASRPSSRKRKRRLERSDYIHLALFAVILLMVLTAAIRLIIWNIGVDSGYDPNADTSEFDTEPQDYIQPMDASLLEGHEDDGIDTIVCLGNAPFSDDRGSYGLATLIAEKCSATVYNCAFPGSYLSMKYQDYSDSYPQDALSLYLVTASLCGGDFTLMEHAAGLVEDKETTHEALETLENVDFSTVDMIVIMYDLSDYMDDRPVMDENNDINLITWNGALNASIQLIQQTYPYIRIVVLSPSYGQFTDADGNLVNADTEDLGNGTLPDYVLHEINVAMANGVSILDNYYGSVTENQAAECLTDGYHLNEAGRERIAKRFAEKIFLIQEEE
ncbi:MAG TPA: hypothetical protein H9717_15695 [Candidatus Eisenbergiella merdipullorum]|uniref:SGNH/GDSL hydrolase family protein n=1 Tax=Candidatus Eisenbergiella merdipullorum TaxID=2838553 RepID=A0A9D2L2J8_9FIRM|nr:hypothetical protein [Candidatus Eisenbergiella merdipullorum]